jgi:hypothetical protein
VHLQLAPVRVGELSERPLIAGPGALHRGLLHWFSLPCWSGISLRTFSLGSVPFGVAAVSA